MERTTEERYIEKMSTEIAYELLEALECPQWLNNGIRSKLQTVIVDYMEDKLRALKADGRLKEWVEM